MGKLSPKGRGQQQGRARKTQAPAAGTSFCAREGGEDFPEEEWKWIGKKERTPGRGWQTKAEPNE